MFAAVARGGSVVVLASLGDRCTLRSEAAGSLGPTGSACAVVAARGPARVAQGSARLLRQPTTAISSSVRTTTGQLPQRT